MNYCPNCGHHIGKPAPDEAGPRKLVLPEPRPARNNKALDSLKVKLHQLAPNFESMSDDAYGDWVNALQFDEFLEFIALDAQGIANEIRIAKAVEEGAGHVCH